MTGWTARRFWKDVTVLALDDGYGILLDKRPLRTPAKAALALPTPAMAEAVAAEWRAVGSSVDPRLMPVTRAANAAIDKVAPQFDEVAAMIAEYGATDLLCFRAAEPDELADAQAAAWDPMLDWADRELGARLTTVRGIIAPVQPAESLARLSRRVCACTSFQLTALHDLVSLSGSLVLGLAATTGDFAPLDLWRLSRFDEDWQARQWGVNEDAADLAERRRLDFFAARHFWQLAG